MSIVKPKSVDQSINDNWLNVFLVASPILAILTKMIIDNYNIKKENILIISFRNTSLEILDYEHLILKTGKYDRYMEKFFFDSPAGRKILKKIKSFDKKFILFTGNIWREKNWLVKHGLCKGHIYIEEGQGSYMNHRPFSFEKLTIFKKIKFNWTNRVIPSSHNLGQEGEGYCYRDDAKAFIGLSENSFPMAPKSKRFIVENFNSIKNHYKPKIIGNNIIGITSSASRHPKKEDIEDMLSKLISSLPKGSIIKPHPSFTTNNNIYNEFKDLFNKINNKHIRLCESNVILEIEMIYEKKQIFGPQSSLSIYTKMLGSKYEEINLF